MYLLKLAIRCWKVAPFSQVFSAFAVGFLLLLNGFLFWMQEGLKPILVRLQGEQVVTAYMTSAIESKDQNALLEEVRQAIGSANGAEVKLVTAPQFISLLKVQYPDLGRELEGLGQDMELVVPRYISVSGMLNRDAIERIKSIRGIESVESSKDRYRQIVGAFSALRWVARVLMVGISLALLTGLIHLSRMNIYFHRDALTLLKFWGAHSGTLAAPSMISGLFVGVIGGVIASVGWLTVGSVLTQHIRALSSILKNMPTVHSYLAAVLLLAGGALGLLSGVLGSFSTHRIQSRGDFGN